MNATNILLGITSLLIVVAFALSFGGLKTGRESKASQTELKELKEEIAELKAESRALELSRLRATRPVLPPVSAPPVMPVQPATTASDLPDAEREALEKQIEALQETVSGLESENEAAMADRDAISDKMTMAAKRVKMAMTMGTVLEASREQAIVIYEPSASAPNYQPGKVLAIRRNDGIIGTIAIDRMDPSGKYVATLRPHGYAPDGYPDVQPGDEIIVDPNS